MKLIVNMQTNEVLFSYMEKQNLWLIEPLYMYMGDYCYCEIIYTQSTGYVPSCLDILMHRFHTIPHMSTSLWSISCKYFTMTCFLIIRSLCYDNWASRIIAQLKILWCKARNRVVFYLIAEKYHSYVERLVWCSVYFLPDSRW